MGKKLVAGFFFFLCRDKLYDTRVSSYLTPGCRPIETGCCQVLRPGCRATNLSNKRKAEYTGVFLPLIIIKTKICIKEVCDPRSPIYIVKV